MVSNEGLLKPAEVAQLLGVPLQTLYAWRHARIGPPSQKVGRHLRYFREEVEEWVRRH
jgi:excisionase family DNA binding protein